MTSDPFLPSQDAGYRGKSLFTVEEEEEDSSSKIDDEVRVLSAVSFPCLRVLAAVSFPCLRVLAVVSFPCLRVLAATVAQQSKCQQL